MNRKVKSFFVVAVSMLAAACSKENRHDAVIAEERTIQVCVDGEINGYILDEGTKADAQTIVRVMWAGSEKVYAYDATRYLGTLTASVDGTDKSWAKLSGEILAPAGNLVTLVYSSQFAAAPAISNGKISLDLSQQNSQKVPFMIYGTLEASEAQTITDAKVNFALATSVYKCNCADLPLEGSFVQARIGEVNTVCELTLSNNAEPSVAGTTPGVITRGDEGVTAADQRAIFQVALAPSPAVTSRTIKVIKGDVVSEAAFAKTAFTAAKSYNALFMLKVLKGALPGEFSVSSTKKVYFSRGNLQATYDGTKYTWDFAEHQNDYIGNAAGNTTINSQTSGAVVDLFAWSTEKTHFGIIMSNNIADYSGDFRDWGIAYCGSKGITPTDTWRTLSQVEWAYLFNTRTVNGGTGNGKSYSHNITYGGRKGLVLYPDGYTGTALSSGTNYTGLPNGVVFLPAAGGRNRGSSTVINVDSSGFCWSSTTADDVQKAYFLDFNSSGAYPDRCDYRDYGFSVRLVTAAN